MLILLVDELCDPDPCNKGGATGETCSLGICSCGMSKCKSGEKCRAGTCGMYSKSRPYLLVFGKANDFHAVNIR